MAVNESWTASQVAVARHGLDVLFVFCDGLDESRVELSTFNRWLQRHQDYSTLLRDAFLNALDQQSTCPHRPTVATPVEEPSWVVPSGFPHPQWEQYLNDTSEIPVCWDCLAEEDNIEGFLESESERITQKGHRLISAFIEHFLGNAEEGSVLGARIPADAYIRWVNVQDLTEPWYAYSVTGRYICRFMRNCPHLDGFTVETLEAFEN